MTKRKARPLQSLSFYERLFARAYTIKLTKTTTDDDPRGVVTSVTEVKDADSATAYRLLVMMRNSLQLCARQFRYYGQQHESHLGDHLSLVERQNLEGEIARNLGIAGNIEQLLETSPELPPDEWRDIKTAPQDGSYIRVLGKRDDSSTYIETTRWYNIKWAIELMHGYGPPTHWLPMERLPHGY